MTDTVRIRWECRHCGRKHKWMWARHDVLPGGPIRMNCEACKAITEASMLQSGARTYTAVWRHTLPAKRDI